MSKYGFLNGFRVPTTGVPIIAITAAPIIKGALRLQRAESQTVVQIETLAKILGGTDILEFLSARVEAINQRAHYSCACQL